MEFKKELESLINRYCRENGSNTPDFILAEYLNDCLEVWNEHVNRREKWYGREPQLIGEPVPANASTVQADVPSVEREGE